MGHRDFALAAPELLSLTIWPIGECSLSCSNTIPSVGFQHVDLKDFDGIASLQRTAAAH
jgi:hypothetical protein